MKAGLWAPLEQVEAAGGAVGGAGRGRRRSDDPHLLWTAGLQHFHGTATCPDYLINSERTKAEGIPEEEGAGLLMPRKVCQKFDDAGNSGAGNPAEAGT